MNTICKSYNNYYNLGLIIDGNLPLRITRYTYIIFIKIIRIIRKTFLILQNHLIFPYYIKQL